MTEPHTEDTASVVRYERHHGVALVTIDRPESLNSLSTAVFQGLRQAMDRAEADPEVRALVLTGAGRAFCAGGDLSERDVRPGPGLRERASPGPLVQDEVNPTALKLARLRMPTVAAVNGVAAGAGVSLALGCDVVIAGPQAYFTLAFSKVGLVPDAGASGLLVERLGLGRALPLAMTGDRLPATQARDWGLIWDVADDPVAASLAMAERLARMPTRALVATRGLMRGRSPHGGEAQLQAELEALVDLGHTEDYLEGVTAFMEKRPARFVGR
jgi:2-(1,2-epoxy-1,2-dihydrophenyl)acetyl-CoA isomerase